MNIKGKILATASAAVLVITLGACDSTTEEPQKPAPSATPTLNATPPPTLPDGSKATNPTPSEADEIATGGIEAPKGLPETSTGGFQTASAKKATAVYNYAAGTQGFGTGSVNGAYADVKIAKPYLKPQDFHTLGEIGFQGGTSNNQIVEVGWTVDGVVNDGPNEDEPHLFVFHWVDGDGACYNGCGFVNYGSRKITPGDEVPENTTKQMGVQIFEGNYWVSYDRSWVGYFPGSLWSASTDPSWTGKYVQFFGEVAAADAVSCTDMGTGNKGTSSGALSTKAAFLNVSYVNGPPVSLFYQTPTSATNYDSQSVGGSARSFAYGGPGTGAVVGGC